ncbi:sterile alpha motif domain-containing protein 3-like, partial [Clarias magur]
RWEIVEQRLMIGEFKNRWPALFFESEINAEFLRITTKPLRSKFLAQLDHFSEKLIQIFNKKGGVKGQKIKAVLAIKDSCDIDIKRECILRSLVIYLNEDPDSFFKEYL